MMQFAQAGNPAVTCLPKRRFFEMTAGPQTFTRAAKYFIVGVCGECFIAGTRFAISASHSEISATLVAEACWLAKE